MTDSSVKTIQILLASETTGDRFVKQPSTATFDIELKQWEDPVTEPRERLKRMKNYRQSDFFQSLGGFHPSQRPVRRIRDYQRQQPARDAGVGYGQEHAEPGEVYIMLGLLRGCRLKAKIGLSRNHKQRLAYLKDDFGRFIVPVFVISTNNMIRLEQAAHRRFKPYNEHEERGSGRTEWFRINPIRLFKMIWFLYIKEKQFACYDRIESFKNNFYRNRL